MSTLLLRSTEPFPIGYYINQWELCLPVYKLVRLYLHFILTMPLEECQTKSFGMNLLLHRQFRAFHLEPVRFGLRSLEACSSETAFTWDQFTWDVFVGTTFIWNLFVWDYIHLRPVHLIPRSLETRLFETCWLEPRSSDARSPKSAFTWDSSCDTTFTWNHFRLSPFYQSPSLMFWFDHPNHYGVNLSLVLWLGYSYWSRTCECRDEWLFSLNLHMGCQNFY